jgi:catechol 2,3-dioxygenase-like lactoylglutathione lyase family enzyme
MRLDHMALRVKDRKKTADFFISAFGYRIQQEFTIDFGDGQTAQCIALEPPEKFKTTEESLIPWTISNVIGVEYHLAPEIFVSDGSPGSIVWNWVQARGGIGGIHHLAYAVDDVQKTMDEWKEKGYAEFSTAQPISCDDDDLIQVFTKPSELTGVIFEFIKRGEHGFCNKNVLSLMKSTKDFT